MTKWHVSFLLLDFGFWLACFGVLAKEADFDPHVIAKLFQSGYFLLFLALSSFITIAYSATLHLKYTEKKAKQIVVIEGFKSRRAA